MNFVKENYNNPNTSQKTSATELKSLLKEFEKNVNSFVTFLYNETDIPDPVRNFLESYWQTLIEQFTNAFNSLINQTGDLRIILEDIITSANGIKSKNFNMPKNTRVKLNGYLEELKKPIEKALKLLPSEQLPPENSESQK